MTRVTSGEQDPAPGSVRASGGGGGAPDDERRPLAPGPVLTQDLKVRLVGGDAKAWRAMSSWVDECAKRGAYKVGAQHLTEDVAAEVMILVHTSFLQRLQIGAPIRPFLTEVARRVALSMRRSRNEDRLVSNEAEEGGVLYDQAIEDFTGKTNEDISAHRARERILKAAPADFWARKAQEGVNRGQYGCGDHQMAAELKFQRKKRRWTQKQMAAYMGLRITTYIAYEHACVMSPPPWVRALLTQMQEGSAA